MSNYEIGLTGLSAAQTAMEVIGNNVANAATDGYHRQRVELVPSSNVQGGGVVQGGVDVGGVTRMIDDLLEREIINQGSAYGQVSQELSTLSALETTFGEFGEGMGLNETIDAFFDALQNLSVSPLDDVSRNAVVSAASVMTSEFRRLGASVESMEDQLVLEAGNTVEYINLLTSQIGELNTKIQNIEVNHGEANNLRDERDQLIAELASLVSVETQSREYGVMDVSIAGVPVVTGGISVDVAVQLRDDQSLALTVAGSQGYNLDVSGGKLGGLFTLRNELLDGLKNEIDTLAKAIVDQVNAYHVQGLGLDGSFAELTGSVMGTEDLSDEDSGVVDGAFYIRVTNATTGEVERYEIDVDTSGATPDTLSSVAAKIDAVDGLNASVSSSRLRVVADLGYTFDFIPAVLSEPTAESFSAAAAPTVSVSGIYSGESNDVFTFTVAGSGAVGNGSLRLNVTDQSGEVVSTLNIGSGYAAGDAIEMANGIKIRVGSGDVNGGDSFEVDAYATTDTSGFLAAAGMNTFFSGSSASEMRVCESILDAPDRIACALGADLKDNAAALQLVHVRDEAIDALDGLTPNGYYQRIVTGLGQDVALKQSRQENIEGMIQNLESQQSELSGVNINDEAAQLMVYQQMFQAMAKYLTTLQTSMTTLMNSF